MTRPLYADAALDPKTRPVDGHAGLWYDKFCDRWQVQVRGGSWSMSSDKSTDADNPKLSWIRTVCSDRVGEADVIGEHAMRVKRLLERRGGVSRVFTAESRFVTGLGRGHPVENGFAWHATLGTPYLPGSSVKGLVRAWAELECGLQPQPGTIHRLLGDTGRVGRVTFLDAVPIAPVGLEADVMTPHYAGWTEADPPGDWCLPTPIPFLVTAPGTSFLFGLLPCGPAQNDDLSMVAGWLGEALAVVGGGAKTSVGYGRFKRDETAEEALDRKHAAHRERCRRVREKRSAATAREKRLAALTPIGREIEEIIESRRDKNMPEVTAIVKEVQRGRWVGDAKMEVATWLEARMKKERRWRETSKKKKPARDKDHQRTLLVLGWLGGAAEG